MDDANLSWVRLTHPVNAPISQRFGDNARIYKAFGLSGHEGIDYACAIGTQVMAAEGGIAWRAGSTDNPWGIRVIVEHILVHMHTIYYTVYAHMSQVYVRSGSVIKDGQIIGLSGNSGNSTGPHLHFCLALPIKNDGYLCPPSLGKRWWHDPLKYISTEETVSRGDIPGYLCGVPINVY